MLRGYVRIKIFFNFKVTLAKIIASYYLVMHLEEEEQYIKRLQTGDNRAFEVIVNHYQNRIYSVVFNMVKNNDDALELTQDVFMKVYQKASHFNFKSKFSTWLYSITYNTTISFLRKKKIKWKEMGEGEDFIEEGVNADTLLLLKEEERKKYISLALDKMGEQQKLLIQLFYLEELNINEIIEVTGFKLSSVKTGLLRARQNLLKHLEILLNQEVNSLL